MFGKIRRSSPKRERPRLTNKRKKVMSNRHKPIQVRPLLSQHQQGQYRSFASMTPQERKCTSGCLSINGTTPKCPFQPQLHPLSQLGKMPRDVDSSSLSLDDCAKALTGKVIEVEGNIGCGKSTLTKLMTATLNNFVSKGTEDSIATFDNHDTTTTDILSSSRDKAPFALLHGELVNQTFLSSFYANPVQYGFAFQMYMLTTRLYQMQTAAQQAHGQGQCAFLDRGAVGDALFALYNASVGSISEQELKIYKSVCADRLPPSLSHKIDIVAYLDVSPRESFRRMNSMRQRESEKEVVPDYIEGIDAAYFELFVKWLGHRKDACGGIDIGRPPAMIILDWSQFGCTKTVLQKLARAAMSVDYYNQIVTDNPTANLDQLYQDIVRPRVKFYHGKHILYELANGKANSLVITTQEQLEKCYEYMFENGTLLHPENGKRVEKLAIDWTLPHTNEFRRVTMKHLSYEGDVIYFNSDHSSIM